MRSAPLDAEQTPSGVVPAEGLPRRCPTCQGRYPADFKVCPRDAIPLEDAPVGDDPLIGTTLADSYELVRAIGEGAMGRVYEARHSRLPSKRYAVKILHQELGREPQVVTRFQREAEAASALHHPNVVGVYDVNHTADGRPYIICEFLDGEPLSAYLERLGKVPIAAIARILRHVCRALAAAHARGIVHRDIKPENVFLSGDPSEPAVKVLDFGISKVADSNTNLTKTGMVMGTPAYMSPEQARGDKVDHRADIYSVGTILYRAVTGHRPFEGLDAMATLTAVLVEEPPRPCAVEPSVPEALEIVIQCAMAKKPEDRYQTMAELDAELAAFDPGGLPPITVSAPVAPGQKPRAAPAAGSPDATARTVLAGDYAAPPATQTLARATREARLARPTIVLLTAFGWLLAMGALVDGIAAAIRWLGAGGDLTTAEVALTVLGAAAVTLTPMILWLRQLSRKVWKSTPLAMQLAQRLRRTVLLGAAAFGVAHLIVRLMETVVRREVERVNWPGWTLVELAVAFTAAAVVWFGFALAKTRL
jgi:tRNA A-37 threonylcarbamoyl transferase component Bud32